MTAGSVSAPLIIPIMHLETQRVKNHINTHTPVSIRSDTPGVFIFYTLDGSKPELGRGSRNRKYTEPILLPAGRVSVRAVAVSSDGRQSSTVTKVFTVDVVELDRKETEDDFLQRSTGEHSPENPAASSSTRTEQRIMGNGPRFLTSRLGPPTPTQTSSPHPLCSERSEVLKQLSSTQTSRVQRETNFLRCAQCLSLRASDPFTWFCPQCGAAAPPLPEHGLPPAEGGQTCVCVFCNTVVPVNTGSCLICEASVTRQLQPQARLTLQDHVVCVCCGSGNPAHISTCLTCESRLQPVCVSNSAPCVPPDDSRKFPCPRCKRLNHSDARYCDWCGSKLAPVSSCVICRRCGAFGNPRTLYCATCGVYLAPPTSCGLHLAPPTSCDITHNVPPLKASHDVTCSSDHAPSVKVPPPTLDQSTQTVGLYYPSATELSRKELHRALQLSRQLWSRDRQAPLTAISPGRGYWRKQLDHVCAHLRSYAQNHAPFRTVLGEPRLGRMVSAVIRDDGYEVSLTAGFVSAAREKKQVDPDHNDDVTPEAGNSVRPTGDVSPAGHTQTLSSVTERFTGSDVTTGRTKSPKTNLMPKSPDVLLLKELSLGAGDVGVVQQLLDQGADPSYCGSDGRHALLVAVVNSHSDVLPVLVQRGADVDQQSGPMKNTALHEAAAQGPEGMRSAEVLLSCRASVRRRNAAGQTAFDVAVSSGSSNMAALLAAQTGLELLDQHKQNLRT